MRHGKGSMLKNLYPPKVQRFNTRMWTSSKGAL